MHPIQLRFCAAAITLTSSLFLLAEARSATKPSASSLAPVYSSALSLAEGWYELKGEWTLTGANTFAYQTSLFAHGMDGTSPSTLVASLNGTLVNSEIASSPSLYFAISGQQGLRFDNVAIIPEPSSLTLFGFAGLLFGANFLRRRI